MTSHWHPCVMNMMVTMLLYVAQYVFVTELAAGSKMKTVHEELSKHLKVLLRPTQADQMVVGKFMKHSWFFFEVLLKSMAQHLLSTGRIKVRPVTMSCCQYTTQVFKFWKNKHLLFFFYFIAQLAACNVMYRTASCLASLIWFLHDNSHEVVDFYQILNTGLYWRYLGWVSISVYTSVTVVSDNHWHFVEGFLHMSALTCQWSISAILGAWCENFHPPRYHLQRGVRQVFRWKVEVLLATR